MTASCCSCLQGDEQAGQSVAGLQALWDCCRLSMSLTLLRGHGQATSASCNPSYYPLSTALRLQHHTPDWGGLCCRWGAEASEQVAKDRKAQQYPRRVAPSRDERQGAAHAAYLARMAAHFAEVSATLSRCAPAYGAQASCAYSLMRDMTVCPIHIMGVSLKGLVFRRSAL